jgi:flagellar hook-associated protein 1 FlgK
MSGILSNAISGLQSSQNALRTAGHNISNANTQGYSRQTVNYATRPEQMAGSAGYIGSGVTTASIERVVSEFIATQLRSDTSTFNQLSSLSLNIGKIDKLLAEVNTGLSGSLQSFFASMQNGANDPSSTPARQLIITEAQGLSDRFNTLYQRMADIEKGVNTELRTVTQQLNSLTTSLAALNQSVGEAIASGGGNPPNDLLDKRDETLRQIAELTSVQVMKAGNGDFNVFTANGQPLVVGSTASSFSVTNDGKIQLKANNTSIDVTTQITGGQIGGLLEFRDQVLAPAMNDLGRIALTMADEFNKLQQQGIDLDNDYGQKMFTDINDPLNATNRVKHGSNNREPFDRQLNVTITDARKLTSSDYQFDIVPGSMNYIVTRLSDNQVVSQGGLSGGYPHSIEFDGVSLNLTSGSFQGGDTFVIQPTRSGANDIHALLQRPEDLAFGSPIRAGGLTSNTGSGIISSGEVLSVVDASGNILPSFATPGQLSPPIIIRFTSENTYDVLDNSDPANPKHLNPPMQDQVFSPGVSNNVFASDPGETRITGNGDRTGLPADRAAQTGPIPQTQGNGYLAERLNFTFVDPDTGSVSTRAVLTKSGASAMETAAQINALPGVTANAYTTATISGVNLAPGDFSNGLQLTLKGEALIDFTDLPPVPDPALGESAFNDYLAKKINGNPNLMALGIRAQSSSNPLTGQPELRLFASSGVDLDVRFSAGTGASSIQVSDGTGNPNQALVGAGAGQESMVTVGGRVDITMAGGIEMTPVISNSPLFGDSTSSSFAQSTFMGYQVAISGQPKAGDVFTIDFNANGKNDNRNALAMVAMETKTIMQNGTLSFAEGYGKLVEEVGTKSGLAKISAEASGTLLKQSQSMRDSVSGVNLDEEAADLIKFQQVYGANAQVISMVRDLFDTLLGAL